MEAFFIKFSRNRVAAWLWLPAEGGLSFSRIRQDGL